MRTGVSYMGHHNPKHIETDIREMSRLGIDDVLLAAQENDFVHFTGKLQFTPRIAKEHGLRPIVNFWGALNFFGGGLSSQFLLEHPEGFQVALDGSHRSGGCYVNPVCSSRIIEMVDAISDLGFDGCFVDEPYLLHDCFCASCRNRFDEWYRGDLAAAPVELQEEFRRRCVIDYVSAVSAHGKRRNPSLQIMCCIMPRDRTMWQAIAGIGNVDDIGTDIYWVNNDRDVEEMVPLVSELGALCEKHGKKHHEWLQCWDVSSGNEERILEQGRILVRERPSAIYIWAWDGQVGTTEACDNPARAWAKACEVLAMARQAEDYGNDSEE